MKWLYVLVLVGLCAVYSVNLEGRVRAADGAVLKARELLKRLESDPRVVPIERERKTLGVLSAADSARPALMSRARVQGRWLEGLQGAPVTVLEVGRAGFYLESPRVEGLRAALTPGFKRLSFERGRLAGYWP